MPVSLGFLGPGRIIAAASGTHDKDCHQLARSHTALMQTMDQRNQWRFDVDPEGWYWTVESPDDGKNISPRHWRTLKECVDDATTHGYVVWKPEEERRRDQALPVVDALKRNNS